MKKTAPGFKQVYKDSETLRNKSGNLLNVKYSYDIEEIRYGEKHTFTEGSARGREDALVKTVHTACSGNTENGMAKLEENTKF